MFSGRPPGGYIVNINIIIISTFVYINTLCCLLNVLESVPARKLHAVNMTFIVQIDDMPVQSRQHVYTKRFYPCFRMVSHSDDCESVPKKSVILSGSRNGGPYKREDFLDGLEFILQGKIKDSVVTFGPFAKNSEWYLVLIEGPGYKGQAVAGLLCCC